MGAEALLHAAVTNNARWCDAVWPRSGPACPSSGYEQGEDLAAARAAGFRVLGPLRIWTRGSAVP